MDGNLGGIIGDTEIGLENFYRGYYSELIKMEEDKPPRHISVDLRQFFDKLAAHYYPSSQAETPKIDFPGRVKSDTIDPEKIPTIDLFLKTKVQKSEEIEQDSKINNTFSLGSGSLKINISPSIPKEQKK